MNGRSVPEWIGRTADTSPPPRVKLRVLLRFASCCARCWRALFPGDRWSCDHVVALCNGGQNRESNLQPLCSWCRPVKDALDVAEKSVVAKKRLRHYGIKLRPKGKPLMGTKASGWKKKINGEVVRR